MSEKLLDGFLDLVPFANEVERDPRTVRRWLDQPDGLPSTRLGSRILIHVPTARDWLFSRMRGRNPTRAARRRRQQSPENRDTAA
jgi:hypothetical protein